MLNLSKYRTRIVKEEVFINGESEGVYYIGQSKRGFFGRWEQECSGITIEWGQTILDRRLKEESGTYELKKTYLKYPEES